MKVDVSRIEHLRPGLADMMRDMDVARVEGVEANRLFALGQRIIISDTPEKPSWQGGVRYTERVSDAERARKGRTLPEIGDDCFFWAEQEASA